MTTTVRHFFRKGGDMKQDTITVITTSNSLNVEVKIPMHMFSAWKKHVYTCRGLGKKVLSLGDYLLTKEHWGYQNKAFIL